MHGPGRPIMAGLLVVALLLAPGCAREEPSATPEPAAPRPTTTSAQDDTVTVQVFLGHEGLGDPCGDVFPVDREVSEDDPLRGALQALLAGPTAAEREEGYGGWFSTRTAGLLEDVRLEGTRALVSLDRRLPEVIPNASTSCGSAALLAQLDRTTTQFPTVDSAWYSLEGDHEAFYAWLQLDTPDGGAPTAGPEEPTDPSPPPAPDEAPTGVPEPPPAGDRTVPAGLLGTEWGSLPTTDRVVALTFDAGANADALPSILDTLAEAGAPATFFLTGRWVASYPAEARTIGDRYPVGNHTVTHPDLTTLTADRLRAEVEDAHTAVAAATGRDPRPWFRFPYGARTPATIAAVNDLGYGSVRWSVDTLGWKGTSGGMTSEAVVARVLDGLQPGQIVLMHVGSHPTDGSTLDADALPEVIRRIRAAGYRLVDLDTMLAGT